MTDDAQEPSDTRRDQTDGVPSHVPVPSIGVAPLQAQRRQDRILFYVMAVAVLVIVVVTIAVTILIGWLWYKSQDPVYSFSYITAEVDQFEYTVWHPELVPLVGSGYELHGETGTFNTERSICIYGTVYPRRGVRIIFRRGVSGPDVTLEAPARQEGDAKRSVGLLEQFEAKEEVFEQHELGASVNLSYNPECFKDLQDRRLIEELPSGSPGSVPPWFRFLVLGTGQIGAPLTNQPTVGVTAGLIRGEIQFYGRQVLPHRNEPGNLYPVFETPVPLPTGTTIKPFGPDEGEQSNPRMFGHAFWNGDSYDVAVSTEAREIKVLQALRTAPGTGEDTLQVGTLTRLLRDPTMQDLITVMGLLFALFGVPWGLRWWRANRF